MHHPRLLAGTARLYFGFLGGIQSQGHHDFHLHLRRANECLPATLHVRGPALAHPDSSDSQVLRAWGPPGQLHRSWPRWPLEILALDLGRSASSRRLGPLPLTLLPPRLTAYAAPRAAWRRSGGQRSPAAVLATAGDQMPARPPAALHPGCPLPACICAAQRLTGRSRFGEQYTSANR